MDALPRPAQADRAPPMRLRMANLSLALSVAALVVVMLMPPSRGLPPAGQGMLAILAFAVVVWSTEALNLTVSALVIGGLMTFLLAASPDAASQSPAAMGLAAALGLTLSGFTNSAVGLVAMGCFTITAMTAVGLDRRIALMLSARVQARVPQLLVAVMAAGALLAFLIPSATARTALLLPILMGLVRAADSPRSGGLAALLAIALAQSASIWNIGIKSASPQNLVASAAIERQLGQAPGWGEWLLAGAPLSLLLTMALYFILTRTMRSEVATTLDGRAAMHATLQALGPMSPREVRLLVLLLPLLGLWSGGLLPPWALALVGLATLGLALLPQVGVLSWRTLRQAFPWSTLWLFAIGIGMSHALLHTQAASWLAQQAMQWLALGTASSFGLLMSLSLLLIVLHLGFASATALTTAMIPIVLGVLSALQLPGLQVAGMAMLLQFAVSFGFILPMNAPQNMLAYGTGSFAVRDFARIGLALTLAAVGLFALFGLTYWRWLGYLGTG